MTSNDTQKSLQASPSLFNDFIRESVGEYFARERWDIDSGGFTLEYVTEGLEIAVAPADGGAPKFKGWYVCVTVYLIIGVHLPSKAMSLRVGDLNLQETLWDTVHLLHLQGVCSRGITPSSTLAKGDTVAIVK